VRRTVEIERLYQQHGAALVLFGTSITGERALAQDAVQHVFLKFIEDGSLAHVRDLKSYLFATVRNQLLNDSKVRQRTVPLEPESAWFSPPERDFAAEENLRRALQDLPEDQRHILVLHVWGELTFAQIADVLAISANTAASRYRYGIEKLREILKKEEKSAGR
jgi:RNA polymerase sigma-70 factor, ECF subfamily